MSVNVNNDAEMVSLKMRPKPLEPKDPSVWSKTDKEKNDLKKIKNKFKNYFKGQRWSAPNKISQIPGKLCITIAKNDIYVSTLNNGKKFHKTTFSYKCMQHQIPNYLNKFKDLIIKVSWNGKNYNIND